jgi:hypothetical protein
VVTARDGGIALTPAHLRSYNEADSHGAGTTGGRTRMKEAKSSFQEEVDSYLIRHRSILDVLSKLDETVARVNRAVVKAVTTCGCISINAGKQQFPSDIGLSEVRAYLHTHLSGALCDRCREAIETEIGSSLFYTAGLCSLLDLELDGIQDKQHSRIKSLGIFNLT